MATVGADAWRSGGPRADLPPLTTRGERGMRGETTPPGRPRPRPDRPPLPSRSRPADRTPDRGPRDADRASRDTGRGPRDTDLGRGRGDRERAWEDRGRDERGWDERGRGGRDRDDRSWDDRDRDERDRREPTRGPRENGRDRESAPARRSAPVEAGGSRLRGVLAVAAVFLVTLAGAGVDSFVGTGLGTVTLIALALSTLAAAALVRRRDLLSVLVAPPLVFVAVAGIDLALAPSATLNLASIATLLIRGFPTMAVGVVAGLVVAVLRAAARR
jgi:hypothetical protein